MASVRTKFSVGIFVILGISLVVVFVLWLGMSEFFHKGRKYVAYFDESVQGLNPDSSVKYRGVDFGRVKSIGVAPDGRLIEIVFSANEEIKHPEEVVAQLKSVGITGIMFVELERVSLGKVAVKQHFSFTPKYPVITTRPSEIKRFLSDVYDILGQLKSIDFKKISKKLTVTLDNANKAITEADVKAISVDLKAAIENTSDVMAPEKWNRLISSMDKASQTLGRVLEKTDRAVADADILLKDKGPKIDTAIGSVQTAAENANAMFTDTRNILNQTSAGMASYETQLSDILKNIREATSGLNELVYELNREPSLIFFSEPAPAKTIDVMPSEENSHDDK